MNTFPAIFAPGTAEAAAMIDQGIPPRQIAAEYGLTTDALQKRVARYKAALERGAVAPEQATPAPWQVAPGPDDAPASPDRQPPAGGANVLRRTVKAERAAGWSASILVTSDHHFDHVSCDRDLLRHHLEQAAERDAGVLVIGDLFCAMQGKMDRRASKPELRPEYLVDGYLDAIVEDAADWYAPYAPHLWLLTYGNHETKVASYTETDILKRFHREMTRAPGGADAQLGTYAGWLVLDLTFPDGSVQPIRVRYHHGWGGGGPVTLGAIGTSRQAAASDYDVYIQGHIHERWCLSRVRETVEDGRLVTRTVPHICAGTYKAEGMKGMGWHVETGKPIKPLGGYWLHLYWSERHGCVLPRAEEVEL